MRFLATAEVARILGLSAERVRQLSNEGTLRVVAVGTRGARLFALEDVMTLRSAREAAGY